MTGLRIVKRRPLARCLNVAWVILAGVALSSCGAGRDVARVDTPSKKRSKEYFAESAYGVKASPRVVENGPVPKGGGRRLVGDPYVVAGKVYKPRENPNYEAQGLASWYGSAFHGRYTANGEVYDQFGISAAHPTMPLPSYARVTNLDTGSSVIVRVNDRGPFHQNRVIDLSDKAAELLDVKQKGTARVRVKYVGPADMSGHDMPYLMASYVRKGERRPGIDPLGGGQIASGVMVASNAPRENFMDRFGGPSNPGRPLAKSARPSYATMASAAPAPAATYTAPVRAVAPPVLSRAAAQQVPVAAASAQRIDRVGNAQASYSQPRSPSQSWDSSANARPPVTAVQPARPAVAAQQKPVRAVAKPVVIAPTGDVAGSGGGLPPGWHVGPQPVKAGSASAYLRPNEG